MAPFRRDGLSAKFAGRLDKYTAASEVSVKRARLQGKYIPRSQLYSERCRNGTRTQNRKTWDPDSFTGLRATMLTPSSNQP